MYRFIIYMCTVYSLFIKIDSIPKTLKVKPISPILTLYVLIPYSTLLTLTS